MNVEIIYNRAAVLASVSAAKKRALEICGGKAETYAKKECHVVTGRLRNSITHQQEDEDTEVIGTNVDYAPHVELGHIQQPGRYVPAIGKRLVADHVPGYPFIRPALEDHISEYEGVCSNEFKKI